MIRNSENGGRRSETIALLGQIAMIAALMLSAPSHLFAQSAESGATGGASAIWIFSNLSFTGMRAQDRGGTFWKVVCFIFGFPATLLTLMVVEKGSERAYGVDMPRRSDERPITPAPPIVLPPRPEA